MSTPAAMWQRLEQAGIARGPMPADAPASDPWYVSAMVGAAAWLSALFLLFFIGVALASVVRDATSAVVVGALLCAGAIALMRMARAGLFLRQLAVAASLAAQGLVVYGILDHGTRSPLAWLGVAAFEMALVVVAPELVHRVLATLAAGLALRMALIAGGAPWTYPPLLVVSLVGVFVASERAPERDALWSPMLGGLALAVLATVPMSLVDGLLWYGNRVTPAALPPWRATGAALLALAWLAAVAALAHAAQVPRRSRAMALVGFAALGIAVTAWPVPNVVVALVLLLVAFAGGRPALAGVAVLALLGALAHAYYSLQWTLLAKSGALAATGAVLLVAGLLTRWSPAEEDRDA